MPPPRKFFEFSAEIFEKGVDSVGEEGVYSLNTAAVSPRRALWQDREGKRRRAAFAGRPCAMRAGAEEVRPRTGRSVPPRGR